MKNIFYVMIIFSFSLIASALTSMQPDFSGEFNLIEEVNVNKKYDGFCGNEVSIKTVGYVGLEVEKYISIQMFDIIARFNDINKFAIKCYQDIRNGVTRCEKSFYDSQNYHLYSRSCQVTTGRCDPNSSPVDKSLKLSRDKNHIELSFFNSNNSYSPFIKCIYRRK